MRFIIICISLIILSVQLKAQNNLKVEGQIIDAINKQPLPFASIGLENSSLGTISNSKGQFVFYIPDSLGNDKIKVTYLGYESFEQTALQASTQELKVTLNRASLHIDEVKVKPMSAKEIMVQAIANIDSNYANEAFEIEGFYLERLLENDKHVMYAEAFMGIYCPPYGDTAKGKAKLIEGRTRDDLQRIEFLRRVADKKAEKSKKKAERKGEDDDEDTDPIQVEFTGPQDIITDDPIRNSDFIFSKKSIKKFSYEFKPDNILDDKQLFVIYCESKRPMDNMYIEADVYIDKESLAIVRIESKIMIVLPVAVKLAMKLYRMQLNDMYMTADYEYKQLGEKWYPSKTIAHASGNLIKKYNRKQKDDSDFVVDQAFVSTSIITEGVEAYKDDEILSNEKPISEQLGDYNPEFWKEKNQIRYETGN